MAPPPRSRVLKKADFQQVFKSLKPTLFSENVKPTALIQKISSISWSATGTLLATSTSANIRVWNPERASVKTSIELRNAHPKTGAAFGTNGVSGDVVEKVAFCPVQENLLASTGHDGLVRLWDVRVPGGTAGVGGKGTAVADCRVGKEGYHLAWHPDGNELLAGRRDDSIYSIDVRQATERISRAKDVYYNLSFSNSGREVFATTDRGPVKIFGYPSMDHIHSLAGHPATTYVAKHSPSGAYIAVGSADSTISLWDTVNFLCTHTLNAPNQFTSIKDLSFSFDGQFLVAGSGDAARDGSAGLNIFCVETGEVAHTIDTANCPTYVAWHPTRYLLAYGGDPGGLRTVGL
ncbi:hypothetical protein M433DRAFT_41884, partial [Acidomyces richmondensis BFW]